MFLASDLGGYAAVVSSVLAQYDAAKSDPRRGAEHPFAVFGKESTPPEAKKEKKEQKASGRGRTPPLRTIYRKPVRMLYWADRVVRPYALSAGHTPQHTKKNRLGRFFFVFLTRCPA